MGWTVLASVQPPYYEEKSLANNERTIEAGFALLERAMGMGAAFCCLPEFFNVFGVAEKEMPALCSNAPKVLKRAEELAGQYRSFVILPMLVPDGGRLFNRAYFVGDDGHVVGWYDKVHLTLGERQTLSLVPGDEIKTFDTDLGRVAVVICYDVYFPELFASLTLHEPDVIFFSSLQRSDHEMASEAMLKTRAMDAQAYVVRSSYGCRSDVPWSKAMMFGQSCIVHPDGTMLANAGHYEGLAIAYVKLPFDWRRQRCGGYPCASVRKFLAEDRRPDVYES